MQELDDNSLLREYADRDSEEAFATLVARHVNKVYSVALRHTGNPHQAEEITQAVFVILAKKSRGLSRKVILSGWLYQTARLTSVTLIRSEIRRARRQQEAHMQTLANEADDDNWPQIAPLLDAALADLNESDRHAVVLRFFDQKSMKEVGNAMGATEHAAKKRVTRSLEKLRKYFSRGGVNSTTAIIANAISTHSVQAAPAGLAKLAASVAIAKNAAMAGSTLTLIKGALKVMAWTKAKTAIVIGVGVIFATTATVVVERVVVRSRSVNSSASIPSWANDPHSWELDSRVLNSLPPAFILRTTQFSKDGGWVTSDNRSVSRNVSVQSLISTAYAFAETRIIFPGDLPKDKFDLLITDTNEPKERLKDQIKTRFGLVAHPENREMDMFRLKVSNPNPPNLKRHKKEDGSSSWMGHAGKITIRNEALSGFTSSIESRMEKPVLDETGLIDRYDMDIELPNNSGKEAYRRALSEQLGLELVPDRAAIEVLVVEKAN